MIILDITTPTNPVLVARCDTARDAAAVWANAQRAYVANGLYGLAIFGLGLAQTLDFPELPDRLILESPFDLSATASSGLPVCFEIVSGPATISGSTVVLTGPGTVTIRARQAGDETYLPVSADRSFDVNPLSPISVGIRAAGGQFEIQVQADPGVPLTILMATNLALGAPWEQLVTTPAATMPFVITDTNPPAPQRFYRVRIP